MKKTIIAIAALLTLGSMARADEEQKKTEYPLTTCVVSGDELGGEMGEPYLYQYEGREIRFCCKDCVKDFNKDPAQYLKKLDDAAKEEEAHEHHHEHPK